MHFIDYDVGQKTVNKIHHKHRSMFCWLLTYCVCFHISINLTHWTKHSDGLKWSSMLVEAAYREISHWPFELATITRLIKAIHVYCGRRNKRPCDRVSCTR